MCSVHKEESHLNTRESLVTDAKTTINVDNVSHTPQLCASSLWCRLSSAPDLVCPARRGAGRDSHTPLETESNTHTHKHNLIRKGASMCFIINRGSDVERLVSVRFRCTYSLAVNDIFVLSGHSGRPFPGLLVQAVLLRRPRLRLQLTTLKHTHTHTHTQRDRHG